MAESSGPGSDSGDSIGDWGCRVLVAWYHGMACLLAFVPIVLVLACLQQSVPLPPPLPPPVV
jgi:hypothetical protein